MDQRNRSKINFIGIFSFLLIFCSCHTTKKITDEQKTKVARNTAATLIESLRTVPTKSYFTARGTATVVFDGSQQSATVSLQSKRDSVTIVSLRKFGFEFYRIMITRDSVYAIDKFNQNYISEPIKNFTKKYSDAIRTSYLHDLLVSSCFLPDDLHYTLINGYQLHAHKDSMNLDIKVDSLINFPKEVELVTTSSKVSYQTKRLIKIGNDNCAAHFIMKMDNPQLPPTQVEIEWDDLNFNRIEKFKFEIPSHYERKK